MSSDPFFRALFIDSDLDPTSRFEVARAASEQDHSRGNVGPPPVPSGNLPRRARGCFLTRIAAYREGINDLLHSLRSTDLRFIRCILPNLNKAPRDFQVDLLLKQLASNGALEGVHMSRLGFPNRMTYDDFVKRYHLLHPIIYSKAEAKDATVAIVERIAEALEARRRNDALRPLYQFGTSKIFLRRGVMPWLEQQRELVLARW
jgi:myosin protein heavy chain